MMQAVKLAPLWRRLIAYLADLFLLNVFLGLCLQIIYGERYTQWLQQALIALENKQHLEPLSPYLAPLLIALAACYVCAFWHFKQGTPAQLLFKIKVVDSAQFGALKPAKIVMRFCLLYGITFLLLFLIPPQIAPLCMGLLLVSLNFHKRLQGIHDLAAGSVVIMRTPLHIDINHPDVQTELSKKSQREF